jgi:hypothetical protein
MRRHPWWSIYHIWLSDGHGRAFADLDVRRIGQFASGDQEIMGTVSISQTPHQPYRIGFGQFSQVV